MIIIKSTRPRSGVYTIAVGEVYLGNLLSEQSHSKTEASIAELKVAGELSDVQWTVLLTASVTGLFIAMATLQD